MLEYKVVTPVAVEPLTVPEVRLHLRLDASTTEDSLLFSLIKTAREYCEKYTGRALAPQTLEVLMDAFPCAWAISLPMAPLTSVTSIKYTDSAGTETTLAASEYIVDTDSRVGRVVLAYGKTWPTFDPYPSNPIRIRYVAGYTKAPEPIVQAMKLLVGYWYNAREADAPTTDRGSASPEFAVKALLSPYRNRWWD